MLTRRPKTVSEEQFMDEETDEELELEEFASDEGEEEVLEDELESEEVTAGEESEEESEYEEISPDEVDSVVAKLEELISSTDSENIKAFLEEASEQIYYLIYEEEEDGETQEDEMSDAA